MILVGVPALLVKVFFLFVESPTEHSAENSRGALNVSDSEKLSDATTELGKPQMRQTSVWLYTEKMLKAFFFSLNFPESLNLDQNDSQGSWNDTDTANVTEGPVRVLIGRKSSALNG